MPYFLMAVRVGGGLAKLIPMIGDITKELAQIGGMVGEAALKVAAEAPNVWYQDLIKQKELDLCAGTERFLNEAENQLAVAEKKLNEYTTDFEQKLKTVGKPDLRSLQGRLMFI